MKHSFDIVPSPDLIRNYLQANSVAVVIDVLRASSTITTALHNGAKVIYPLESTEEATKYAKQGMLVGAERNLVICDFAKFGNDPCEYTSDIIKGEEIYFTTTNGTRTIKSCIEAGHEVVIGSFVNHNAVVEYCRHKHVLAVCAGWKGKPSKEDILYAAALGDALSETHDIVTDVSRMFVELWQIHKHDILGYTMECDHYKRMISAHVEGSFKYCMTFNISDTLPVATILDNGLIAITP